MFIPVDDCYLYDFPTDHDETHRSRQEYSPFALNKLCGGGEQHPASDPNEEDETRDSIIAEGCALQKCDW